MQMSIEELRCIKCMFIGSILMLAIPILVLATMATWVWVRERWPMIVPTRGMVVAFLKWKLIIFGAALAVCLVTAVVLNLVEYVLAELARRM